MAKKTYRYIGSGIFALNGKLYNKGDKLTADIPAAFADLFEEVKIVKKQKEEEKQQDEKTKE